MILNNIKSFFFYLILAGYAFQLVAAEESDLERKNRIIDAALVSISNLSNYMYFQKILEENHNTSGFQELHALAVKDITYPHGLHVKNVCDGEFCRKGSEYAYHGSRAALEILDAGHLKAYQSKSGWGIYFGRDLSTSYGYATDDSSNIHNTWKGSKVRAVFVYTKDITGDFVSNDGGTTTATREYHIIRNTYSNDNLHDIFFLGQDDLDSFIGYFNSKDILTQEKLRKVNLHLIDMRLNNINKEYEFKQLLLKQFDSLFQNPLFVANIFLGRHQKKLYGKNIVLDLQFLMSDDDNFTQFLFNLAIELRDDRALNIIYKRIPPLKVSQLCFTPNCEYFTRCPFKILLSENFASFHSMIDHISQDVIGANRIADYVTDKAIDNSSVTSLIALAQIFQGNGTVLSKIAGAAEELTEDDSKLLTSLHDLITTSCSGFVF